MLSTETETGEALAVPAEQLLANLLFGAYRHRVLSLLLLRPGDSFHVRMISRLTGVPAGSLHRELRQLADAGLLNAVRVGNQIHYSANEASPVFEELAAVLEKTAGAPPTLDDHSAEHSIELLPRPKPRPGSKRKARSRARAARR
jgi:DNA-binding transcriptional ArsR family regulator